MKKYLFILLLLCVFFTNAQTDFEKAARIDLMLRVYTKKNMFCGSVLIAKKGKVLLSKGYGMANNTSALANSPTTKFKLASVSKQFTAMAIMILQEKGKLSTEDKLTKYIADYPNGDKITIHNLLTHTSGIPNVTALPVFDSIKGKPHTLEQIIALTKDKPLEFEPGSKFKYSNSGYILLTYIIEKASGKNYSDYMKENIFDPLGMKNSGLYPPNGILKNSAIGYTETNEGLIQAAYIDMTIPAGAGALYSTVEDLFLWDQALYSEKLVKKETIEKIMTVFLDNYAYGWMVTKYKEHKKFFHGGGIEGFNTVINRFTDDDMCIIILKNVDNYQLFNANKMATAIMFGEKFDLPTEHKMIAVNKSIYKTLVGEYELKPGFILSITTDGINIYSQATGQDKYEIYPEKENFYFLKIVDAQIEFNKDDTGNITSLTLYQGGAKMPARKIK
ncbi:MAG: serine hydrolase [Bacteroidetes bacterium]|nr:serine hydrolase [Bacteroidota bacterium]